ncbi:MAG: TAT-variant-translocated molybdopterin oxidoreductase, partial [Flavobacteriaceae bacterium]|nr:TAT-variant-translocated molybdopterin oxidoreductase [Flavobacteriaceae bacterium]
MASNKRYWKSEAELNPNDSIIETLKQNEFPEQIPVDEFLGDKEGLSSGNTNRRDFLKYVGFSTAAATVAACEGPVRKSIPYVVQPERIVPGVANYYATTIANGFDFASILIKTREGRPIKVENNKDAKIQGSANARIQASVLSLYDSTRLQGPTANGNSIEWDALDTAAKAKFASLQTSGRQIAFLTQTYASPSTSRLIGEFKEKFGNVNHVSYDAISEEAAISAYQDLYGSRALADYDFSKAELIVSFGADFLSDWQGGGYDSGYAKGRVPAEGKMSRHIQFESNMSLTGANADKRIPLTPSEQKKALASLFGQLNGSGVSTDLKESIKEAVDQASEQIRKAGAKAVVVTGLNDLDAQKLVLAINKMLNSEAFDASAPRYTRQGNNEALSTLIQDMNAGNVGALIIDGVNPMFTLPNAEEFAEAAAKVDMTVAFSLNQNETTEICQFVAASNHYLESWGDVEMKKGHYSLTQPAIRELFDTRQFQQAVLSWMDSEQSYYEYIKDTWTTSIIGENSWDKALHDGVYSLSADEDVSTPSSAQEGSEAAADMEEMAASVQR